ncbi:hypothetical protein [Undibacterium luofuense]|uniref:hypothetical protein n=1 Tax=Undibacterium luofuense TaxID=2828733 RepID=UPI0030EDAFB4
MGSSPISHPKIQNKKARFDGLFCFSALIFQFPGFSVARKCFQSGGCLSGCDYLPAPLCVCKAWSAFRRFACRILPQLLRMIEAAGIQLARICLYRHLMIAEARTFCRGAPDCYAKIRISLFFESGGRCLGQAAGPVSQGLRIKEGEYSAAL